MATRDKRTFIGTGEVFLDGRKVGNNSQLELTFEANEINLPDYTNPGGGLDDTVTRIENMSVALNLHDFNPENLAMALYGSKAAVTAATVTDEAVSAPATLDRLVETAHMIDTSVSPVVTNSPATTTYVEDTDYEVNPAGIIPLSGGSISASQSLLVDYTKDAIQLIQMLVTSGTEYELIFDGWNEAQSEPFYCKFFKFKPGAAAGLALVSEGAAFGGLSMNGKVVSDSTKTGSLSKYGIFKLPTAA